MDKRVGRAFALAVLAMLALTVACNDSMMGPGAAPVETAPIVEDCSLVGCIPVR